MRILHTESSCGWGGQEIRIVSESEGLAEMGYEVIILCDRESSFRARAKLTKVSLVQGNIAKKSILCLFETWRLIREIKPDLIVTHSSTDSWLVAVSLLFTLSPMPVIRCRHVSAPVKDSRLTRWLYQTSSHIVTTSNDIKSHLQTTLGIDQSLITSIPTGVDPGMFAQLNGRSCGRKNLGIDQDSFVILMVATLRSWKGHKFVLSALEATTLDKFDLLVVGDGPQMTSLVSQVERSELLSKVHFLGHQDQVEKYFSVADCFCQPSIKNEGVSQSVLQAFLAKVPVVATAVSGLNQVVDDKTAVVVRPENVLDLKEAFEIVARDPAFIHSKVEQGFNNVSLNYTRDEMLRRIDEIYSSFHRPGS